ncbi:LysM peptidoglycan-binding domain-containing protein [Streptomyces sp. NPDC089799]|uniref:LysM peptidoglycan-binding domain-containing protein n=1 Tax=Streptomyces sp. NPDC089799 TaxID=3155066 RepID=UPI0034154607
MPNTKPAAKKTARSGRGPAATAAAVVRGLASLALLLGLLAGLPILLWWATTLVGPPGLAALSALLSTDDSGQVFLLALAVAGWIGWALFACAVLVEIPAQLRGRAAPHIRGLVGQRAAASLVGAVLLALPAGTALAATPATPAHAAAPTTATASAVPGNPQTSGAGTVHAAATPAGNSAVTHTVRDAKPAESLWSIAEARLGDGTRWGEIAALNEGRSMTDGSTFHADRSIQPGWVLHLPDDARPQPRAQPDKPADQDGGTSAAAYTVQAGDSLTGIAQNKLGSADRYGEIFDLNKGSQLPGGGTFTDPDLIRPGQQLALPQQNSGPQDEARPTPPTPAPEPEAKPVPAPSATAPATPASPVPSSTASQPAAVAPSAPATASPSTPASPQIPQPTPSVTAAPAPAEAEPVDSREVNTALVSGIGALLAASLASALGVRRILQQRERRAGQTIAQDEDPTQLEQVLAATSEPAGIELLDRVLRTLAHHAAAGGHNLPVLRGARLDGNEVTLLLDEPAQPVIEPFTAGPSPRMWTLDKQAGLLSAKQLADVHAPYPGLVTLGADADGLVLIDLMTCQVLLLDGTPEEVLEVARALALELGTCGWTDYSEILTTGLGARLAGLLPQGRIRSMPHLPSVATDLGELMLEAHQSGEQVLPWLAVGAGEMDEEHLVQLADALAAGRDLSTGVVLPASAAARHAFPHAHIITTAHDQHADVGMLETAVELQRITDEQYRQYVHALQVSTTDPEPAAEPWEKAEDHGQAAGSGTPLTLHAAGKGATDPGNPFPALLAGLTPTPAPAPAGTDANTDAGPAEDNGGDARAKGGGAAGKPGGAAPKAPPAPEAATGTEPALLPGPAVGEDEGVRIEVLGPLRIRGGNSAARNPRTAALAALIHLRPGRTSDYLCQAMDPVTPWTTHTLQSRLSELRSVLGQDTDGQPLLPRPKAGSGYALHRAVTSDWDHFQNLATQGLAAGPPAGIQYLEAAMVLVRGKPFAGRTPPWADPVVQDMLSRITDIAHTLARWHTDGDRLDLDAARRTIEQGLDVEETAEVLYRDLLTIEWATGNTVAVRRGVARIQQMARTYDITLDDATEEIITQVLSSTAPMSPLAQV